jgi:hypothetical protein
VVQGSSTADSVSSRGYSPTESAGALVSHKKVGLQLLDSTDPLCLDFKVLR